MIVRSGLALAVLLALGGKAFAVQEAAPPDAHVEAVRDLVAALESGQSAAFESEFADRVRGMQPDELWAGAQRLVERFGDVAEVSFGSVDERTGGVYVAVRFATAEREVFVRLDDEGQIRQLLYVPPTAH